MCHGSGCQYFSGLGWAAVVFFFGLACRTEGPKETIAHGSTHKRKACGLHACGRGWQKHFPFSARASQSASLGRAKHGLSRDHTSLLVSLSDSVQEVGQSSEPSAV